MRVDGPEGPARVERVSHVPGSAGRAPNPVAGVVAADAPHLDPAKRDRYRVRLLPTVAHHGRRLRGAEATIVDIEAGEAVRRVRSWVDAATGAPYAVEVWRTSTSAIFDEESRAGVFFGGGAYPLPRAGTLDSHVSVPFGADRRVRMDVLVEAAPP